MLPFEFADGAEAFGPIWHLGSPHSKAELEACTTGKLWEPFFRQYPFHRADRKLHSLSTEKFNDISGGEPFFPPGNDLSAGLGTYLVTGGFALLGNFQQVDLAVPELMAQEAHVARREAESFSHKGCWQPIDKEGSKCFVAPLPSRNRLSEEGDISHICYI